MIPAISIVDDCGDLRKLMVLVLESEGIEAIALASLAEVRRYAEDVLQSCAVVLDINLGPEQPDGVAVYEWLREQAYAGRVFFLTGHAKDSPRLREAAETGVPILEKPMVFEQLVPQLVSSVAAAGPPAA